MFARLTPVAALAALAAAWFLWPRPQPQPPKPRARPKPEVKTAQFFDALSKRDKAGLKAAFDELKARPDAARHFVDRFRKSKNPDEQRYLLRVLARLCAESTVDANFLIEFVAANLKSALDPLVLEDSILMLGALEASRDFLAGLIPTPHGKIALEALGEHSSPQSARYVLAALKDPNLPFDTRSAAVAGLSATFPEKAVAADLKRELLALARSADDDTRILALSALSHYDERLDEFAPQLRRAIASENEFIRHHAIVALGSAGQAGLDALIEVMKSDRKDELLLFTSNALSNFTDAQSVAKLIEMKENRLYVLRALALMSHSDAVAPYAGTILQELERNSEDPVAIQALGALKTPEAELVLLRLAETHPRPEGRAAALQAYFDRRPASLEADLARLSQQGPEDVRSAATAMLQYLKNFENGSRNP